MKKFLVNSIIFFFVVVALLVLGLILPNQNTPRTIDYALIKKHELINTEKRPKLILTGGSNVLFGFNSEIISQQTNKPVINHAIHAGYGLQYIIDDLLQQNITKGDTIILAPEYSHFIGNGRFGNEPLLFSLTAVPKNIKLIRLRQLINMSSFLPKFAFGRIKSFIYNLKSKQQPSASSSKKNYTEYSINAHGDHNTHWNLGKTAFDNYEFTGKIDNGALEMLQDFNARLKTIGATLIITFPSLTQSSYQLNATTIQKIHQRLLKNDFSIIGQPKDYVFENTLFYDTPYHLNGKGVLKRTHLLLEHLKSHHD